MITAVDTSVLLDVFTADDRFGRTSHDELTRSLAEGGLVACEVVWAEAAAGFQHREVLVRNMETLGVRFDPLDEGTALRAGTAWRAHRLAGGTRRRILAGFLIGAHAVERADRLLTRDRRFYRSHFAGLTILEP